MTGRKDTGTCSDAPIEAGACAGSEHETRLPLESERGVGQWSGWYWSGVMIGPPFREQNCQMRRPGPQWPSVGDASTGQSADFGIDDNSSLPCLQRWSHDRAEK